jgi:two-component system sensor histidine kinase KdpD
MESAKGRLKVYLGYAPGVGKTFQMLSDARDALARGAEVMIGYLEAHKRADTMALAQGLEAVPRRVAAYRGKSFEEMDTDAIVARHPQIALVDEFAHTNVPGSPREKRWQDVLVLLDAGLEVWTTLNVQHLESLNDIVFDITGVRVRETVPDWVLKQAAETVFVDVTPEALLNRLRRGAVYTGEMAQRAVERFFREGNLHALRELGMREAAHEVQVRQSDPAGGDVPCDDSAPAAPDSAAAMERILVLVTADAETAMLLRRARRVADYLRGDCLAVFIHRDPHFADVPTAEREAVERHLNFARNLRTDTRILHGEDLPRTLADFATTNGVTQIFLPRSLLRARAWGRGSKTVREIIRQARNMQVTVVATRAETPAE